MARMTAKLQPTVKFNALARIERNARELKPDEIPEPVDLVVADVSFISVRVALPPALALALSGWQAVVLVKPQFEAGRADVGKGGVVRDPHVQAREMLPGIEEMDLEAVLRRNPAVAVVDEIPHTNVPGSKNRKRYQDVLDLLGVGINVIGALNIQHLESLNDLIARNTGVTVRETR